MPEVCRVTPLAADASKPLEAACVDFIPTEKLLNPTRIVVINAKDMAIRLTIV